MNTTITSSGVPGAADAVDGYVRTDEPIEAVSITVKPDRVICVVRIADEGFRFTSEERAARALDFFPTLAEHACVNGHGPTLGAVIEATSIAHLLEHVWIELLVRQSHDPAARFVGTTEWVDEAEGTARIQVSYRDDLQALRTFNEALQFLNTAVLR